MFKMKSFTVVILIFVFSVLGLFLVAFASGASIDALLIMNDEGHLVVSVAESVEPMPILDQLLEIDGIIIRPVEFSKREMEAVADRITAFAVRYLPENDDAVRHKIARSLTVWWVDERENHVLVGLNDISEEHIALFKAHVVDSKMVNITYAPSFDLPRDPSPDVDYIIDYLGPTQKLQFSADSVDGKNYPKFFPKNIDE